ncbi:hypothetical protein K0M31_011389, partial [Melipona bicolor]
PIEPRKSRNDSQRETKAIITLRKPRFSPLKLQAMTTRQVHLATVQEMRDKADSLCRPK